MKMFKFYYNWDWYKLGFGIYFSKNYPSYFHNTKKIMLDIQLLWLNFYIIYTIRED